MAVCDARGSLLLEPERGAASISVDENAGLSWTVHPAVRTLGMWLVAVSPAGGGVKAVVPPGVALASGRGCGTAHRWRHAHWRLASRFDVGLDPDVCEEFSDLPTAMICMPRNVHEWMAEATERHVKALRRGASLRQQDSRPRAAARSGELLQRAAIHAAELDSARRALMTDPSMQREFATLLEVASTVRRVAYQLDSTAAAPTLPSTLEDLSQDVLRVIDEMRPVRDELARIRRDYNVAMASRSWRLTKPLRTATRQVRALRARAAAAGPAAN